MKSMPGLQPGMQVANCGAAPGPQHLSAPTHELPLQETTFAPTHVGPLAKVSDRASLLASFDASAPPSDCAGASSPASVDASGGGAGGSGAPGGGGRAP